MSSTSKVETPNPGGDLPPRVLKRLSTLGHHVAAWGDALEALRGRLHKHRLPEAWQAHVRVGLPEARPSLQQLEIHIQVPDDDNDAADWFVDPESNSTVPALTAGARALLHLPALQKTWSGWLRGSLRADLRLRLGRAWIVDPTALPAQGALPGLGIARWGDFARLAESGRRFRIEFHGSDLVKLDANALSADWEQVAQRLAGCEVGAAVVEELPIKARSLRTLTLTFALRETRWEMLG
jgi:hypothetical protein